MGTMSGEYIVRMEEASGGLAKDRRYFSDGRGQGGLGLTSSISPTPPGVCLLLVVHVRRSNTPARFSSPSLYPPPSHSSMFFAVSRICSQTFFVYVLAIL